MRMMNVVLLTCILGFAVLAHADYQLDNANSTLNFISIKKGKIAEVHSFKQLSGGVNKVGAVEVEIDLASVETNIDVRNERAKTMLFETGLFPKAVVSTHIDSVQLQALKAGDVAILPVKLAINLHGRSKTLDTELRVIAMANGGLLVTSIKPILLNSFDYGLNVGIQKLMEVAKLPSISTAVPVTFSLVFKTK